MNPSKAKSVYVWDMDETLILFKSLCNGTFAQGFRDGVKDVPKGNELGRMWENIILQVCDDFFFFDHIDEFNLPYLDFFQRYDDGASLADYNFRRDGFNTPCDDASRRKLAYRHRAIAAMYEQGLGCILDAETINHWNELYSRTDQYTDNWLSSARALLESCVGSNEESSTSRDEVEDGATNATHVLVTSGCLVPSVAKCLLFKLDGLIPHGNIYSSFEVGKRRCFQWIKERFNGPDFRFCAIGDGWEECEAAQYMKWAFVQINPHPDGPHRFPGVSLKTLGYYLDVVYGNDDSDNCE